MLRHIGIQKQQFSVLPQQIQLLNLFHLTSLELSYRIKDELNDNPMLEEDTCGDESDFEDQMLEHPDFQDEEEYQYDDVPTIASEHANYLPSNNSQRQFRESMDFRKTLKQQMAIHAETEREQVITNFLIDHPSMNKFIIGRRIDDSYFRINFWCIGC